MGAGFLSEWSYRKEAERGELVTVPILGLAIERDPSGPQLMAESLLARLDELGPVVGVGREGADRQLAEAASERNLVVGGDVLVAEHQHAVCDECGVDFRKPDVAQIHQVGAADFGTDGGRNRRYLHGG